MVDGVILNEEMKIGNDFVILITGIVGYQLGIKQLRLLIVIPRYVVEKAENVMCSSDVKVAVEYDSI